MGAIVASRPRAARRCRSRSQHWSRASSTRFRRAACSGAIIRCSFATSTTEKADIIVSKDAFEHFDDPAAILRITWLDGQTRVHTLTTRQQQVQLYGGADDDRGVGEIASAYVVLGVEHILGGFDHLMFVIALLFLVGFNKRLVLTITAFTVAHSLTLASSALGWLTLRSPPVEATIALSILLVVVEAMHSRQTLARRWPALVAFLFGLVHGLGFAGALKDIGLPDNHLPVALLTFNVGVELGQLLVVGLAFAVWKALARAPQFVAARVPALYLMGSIAAYWSIERVLAVVS